MPHVEAVFKLFDPDYGPRDGRALIPEFGRASSIRTPDWQTLDLAAWFDPFENTVQCRFISL
jgi:hypothetical protein